MSKKRECKFNEELSREFPFIKKTKIDYMVRCDKCNTEFSVSHGGKNDITKHLATKRHRRFLNNAVSSSKIEQFFRSASFGNTEVQLALAEGLFAFHTLNHNQSFRSMDYVSQMIKTLYDKKFACARTKTEAIICNVFSP